MAVEQRNWFKLRALGALQFPGRALKLTSPFGSAGVSNQAVIMHDEYVVQGCRVWLLAIVSSFTVFIVNFFCCG